MSKKKEKTLTELETALETMKLNLENPVISGNAFMLGSLNKRIQDTEEKIKNFGGKPEKKEAVKKLPSKEKVQKAVKAVIEKPAKAKKEKTAKVEKIAKKQAG